MGYVWDPKKARRNLTAHGIAFEDAIGIFEGPTLERVDDRFEYGEVRVFAIGRREWNRDHLSTPMFR